MPEYVSLFPPILVLIIGFLTRQVVLSLLAGILLAAFLASQLQILASFMLVCERLWVNLEVVTLFSQATFWESRNFLVFLFLCFLGILVSGLQHSGGVYAYGQFIQKKLKNKQATETASLVLSTLLFIDDYFSALTVGSVMHPLTEKMHIPKVKLAFLVDSMAAPLAILCPFSGWVAVIIGFLRENHIPNPLRTYLHILPFLFYSFILITSVWFIVRKKIAFGQMQKIEQALVEDNPKKDEQKPEKTLEFETHPKNTQLIDFFVPVSVLLIGIFTGMLYSGSFMGFGGNFPFLEALQNANATQGLFLGAATALIFATCYFIGRGKISIQKMPGIYWEGCLLMLPAIIVLLLAWTLGDILREDLNTGRYLASMLAGKIHFLWLPAIFFLVAFLIAFMLGSSWGTAAMIFPIAIPLVVSLENIATQPPLLEKMPILFPVLGAVLSGCVAGDHISPISDTTIMSAASTRCPLMVHVKTQLIYSLPMIMGTFLGFLATGLLHAYGFWISAFSGIGVGIAFSLIALQTLNQIYRRLQV